MITFNGIDIYYFTQWQKQKTVGYGGKTYVSASTLDTITTLLYLSVENNNNSNWHTQTAQTKFNVGTPHLDNHHVLARD